MVIEDGNEPMQFTESKFVTREKENIQVHIHERNGIEYKTVYNPRTKEILFKMISKGSKEIIYDTNGKPVANITGSDIPVFVKSGDGNSQTISFIPHTQTLTSRGSVHLKAVYLNKLTNEQEHIYFQASSINSNYIEVYQGRPVNKILIAEIYRSSSLKRGDSLSIYASQYVDISLMVCIFKAFKIYAKILKPTVTERRYGNTIYRTTHLKTIQYDPTFD
ncbi:hypothetical protein BCR36DRAFT_413423 [Piromyces finnis]|uniref:Uncharacterized protein n=1 Tax=Piromyces finnis TaxID=1754191 RepID=A0A1Y1V6P8_9FUNG|nr:hypothetical protein BCR36DRAFT_413423 [Piromyces finnis]|eukprot:ORX47895.1 hypothetical protein BCR36DRAFT_413423 [Piromyces finnis]